MLYPQILHLPACCPGRDLGWAHAALAWAGKGHHWCHWCGSGGPPAALRAAGRVALPSSASAGPSATPSRQPLGLAPKLWQQQRRDPHSIPVRVTSDVCVCVCAYDLTTTLPKVAMKSPHLHLLPLPQINVMGNGHPRISYHGPCHRNPRLASFP